MRRLLVLFSSEDDQDIAEYSVMVAVILLIVVGALRIIGSNSDTVLRVPWVEIPGALARSQQAYVLV